jgi:hypothetical protein
MPEELMSWAWASDEWLSLVHNVIDDNTWKSEKSGVLGADAGKWLRKQGRDGTSVMLQTRDLSIRNRGLE